MKRRSRDCRTDAPAHRPQFRSRLSSPGADSSADGPAHCAGGGISNGAEPAARPAPFRRRRGGQTHRPHPWCLAKGSPLTSGFMGRGGSGRMRYLD